MDERMVRWMDTSGLNYLVTAQPGFWSDEEEESCIDVVLESHRFAELADVGVGSSIVSF